MRSVVFHLAGVTRQAVADRLSSIATPNGRDRWYLSGGSSAAVLYLSFYDDLEAETEPDDLRALTDALGAMPAVTVIADVSGRAPGDVEVRDFAAFLLGEFRGVAWDDYTCHCWTLSEIQSGLAVSGHAFFDYNGW